MAAPAKRRMKTDRKSLWLDDYPFYYMSHVVAESQRRIQEAIRPLKINPSEWRVIFVLHDHGELAISEISEECLIEVSTLSRLLKSLENRELISRMRDDQDQRYTKIKLTKEGHKTYRSIMPVVARQLEFALQDLSDPDRKALLRMLKTMKDNVYRSPFAVS
ncbi:MAG: MarR family transcriptional regulator [Gammaproteobacteria bacterium]|nr:MarR family transcriptional regulator [Gammaproteobacteria bacterium]